MSAVRHMFYGSFGTKNSMVAFFSLNLACGNVDVRSQQVNLGQFSKFEFLTKNMPILSSFLMIPKNLVYFDVHQLEMPKSAFQKVKLPHLPVFFYHRTAKSKDIALKFGMCVVCLQLNNIYFVRLDNCKILDLIGTYY